MSRNKQQSGTSQMMNDMADQASTAYDQAKTSAMETGKAALSDMKARAGDVAASMKDGLEARADVAKDSLAEGGIRLAESIRGAAGGENAGTIQAKVLDLVATNVAEISEQLRGRDLQSVVNDMQSFARRNPAIFVAGAAVAGFAIARFLRSSGDAPMDDGDMDTYASNMTSGMHGGSGAMAGGSTMGGDMAGGSPYGDGMSTGTTYGDDMSTGSSAGSMSGDLGGMSGEGFDADRTGSMDDADLPGGMIGEGSAHDDNLLQDGTDYRGDPTPGIGGTRP